MVNLAWRIYNKTGTTLVPGVDLGLRGLFKTPAASRISDPNIVFDNSSKRFFASLMDITNASIKVAVSAPNDPNPSTWNVFNFRIGNCPDQPFVSVSSDKMAISFNTFTSGCVQPFIGAQTLLINKGDMISARPPAFHITNANPNSFREFPVRTSATDEKIFLASISSTGSGAVKLTTFTGVVTTTPPPASASSSQLLPFLQKTGAPKDPPDGRQPAIVIPCIKASVLPPCIDTADAHITGAAMSPDNKILWLTLHEACKNPAPAPARQILSCIRLIQIDTDSSPIGAKKAAMKFDFDIVERNMDLYYPTLTFVGSTAAGTNSMIVAFGGSNSTVFPSLFASGQLGPVGLLLKNSLLPVVQLKSGGSPHLPIVAPPNPPVMRYGDYFGSAVDPTNASASWIAGEYMQGPPTIPLPSWSTVISLVTTFPGNGTLSTGVTNPGAPLPTTTPTTKQPTTPTTKQPTTPTTKQPTTPTTKQPTTPTTKQPTTPTTKQPTTPTTKQPTTPTTKQGTLGAAPANLTQAPAATNVPGQVCADGTGPDPTTGLCADGSQPLSQAFNTTAPGVTTAEQQLVCADGTGPDPTTGLCADGSQPQSQSFNATAPGVTTATPQLVCADGYWTRPNHRPLC